MMNGSPGSRLRVVSWNVHKCVGGTDGRYSLDRIVDCVTELEADLLLLQEVAQGIPRLRHDDQAEMLTDALDMHAAFHPEHHFKLGRYGNLILSRFPLSDVKHLDLTVGWRKKRGALQAHLRVPVGEHRRTIVVNNLHLGLAGSERARQLERFVGSTLLDRLHHDTPLIVGGDLNDLWGTLGPRFLLPRGLTRAGKLANTFPAALPLRPLDGLFFRGSLQLEHWYIGKSRLLRAASDHLPLIADFLIGMDGADPDREG
jgi:endonuclease/exonuclease/phosphatase family metal-dependent hydrolase